MAIALKGIGGEAPIANDLSIVYSGGNDARLIVRILPLQTEVYNTNELLPIVGSKAVELSQTTFDIKGFVYDKRRWVDDKDIRSRNPGYIGDLKSRVSDGTLDIEWQSGIGSGEDCEYRGLEVTDCCNWSPILHHGDYFTYLRDHYLYSGEASSFQVDGSIDLNVQSPLVELDFTPKGDVPLTATIYRRGVNLEADVYLRASRVPQFTGIVVEGEREDTLDDDSNIIWDSVDTTFPELFYDDSNNSIFINRRIEFTVGCLEEATINNGAGFPTSNAVALQTAELRLERLGASDGEPDQIYFTRFFPLDAGQGDNKLDIYIWSEIGLNQWTLATGNDLTNHTSTEEVYEVDYDLGMIRFAKYEEASSRLLNELATEDILLTLADATEFPEKGRVSIGGEEIQYSGRDENILYNLVRVSPADHAIGAEVVTVQSGATPTTDYVVSAAYVTTPRIEYEPKDFSSLLVADNLTVHPLRNPASNGIVHISRIPLEIEDLILTVDKPNLGGGVYGPVDIGSDYALLTATATGYGELPLAGLRITIDETESVFAGLLNGAPEDYTGISNQDGEVMATFAPGGNLSLAGEIVDSFDVVDLDTVKLTVNKKLYGLDIEDVTVFVITKDDPSVGAVGIFTDGVYVASSPYSGAIANITGTTLRINNQSTTYPAIDRYPAGFFDGGTLYVRDTSGNDFSATIMAWRDGEFHINTAMSIVGTIAWVRVLAPDWEVWDANLKNGRKRVIYTYSPTAINPVTGVEGAYNPVNPTSIEVTDNQTIFTFDYALIEPDASDVTENVGGYWLAVDHLISFRAYADSPLSGRRIYSNIVKLRVSLPDYLSGVYLAGSSQSTYWFHIRDIMSDPS